MTHYEEDFYAWTREQAVFLKEGRFTELDVDHLIEELETLGRAEWHALESRVTVILTHLLKWHYQPEKRSRSWELTLLEQRTRVEKLLRDNPSLRYALPNVCVDAYALARIRAARQTHLPLEHFPVECPWTLQDVLDEEEER
jgi:hypothetical protein